MYTIIDNKIYAITDKSLIECNIYDGGLVRTKETIEVPSSLSSVLTYQELKLKFKTSFENSMEEEDEPNEIPKTNSSKTNDKLDK